MIISACLIVKDDSELDNLKRAIKSIAYCVDEVIVVSNGESIHQIRAYCKGSIALPFEISYFHHPWTKDFSEQRNFAASKVRKDADFYIWLDADDVLVGADRLRDIASKAKRMNLDSVFFNYWYFCTFDGEPSADTVKEVKMNQMRERLIRPGSIIWHKRLHETPVPVEGLDYKYTQIKYSPEEPIAWLHLGVTENMSEEDQKIKTGRNRELLELELADERKTKEGSDPRTLLYLMKIYAEMDDERLTLDCIKMGEEYLTKSGWDAERAICCSLIAKSLGKLGQEKEAKDFLFKSIQEYPYDPVLYLHLARVCFNLKQYHEMKHWLDFALSLDTADTASTINNLGELKVLSTRLTMNYYFSGERNVKKAYKAARMLYKEQPTQENKDMLDYLKEMNDLDEASGNAHKLMLYYQDLDDSKGVVKVIESMPENMQNLPFAWHMYNKHKIPRAWKSNEICYYATFGQAHFEQWGPDNLETGIGGSETAVIKLAKEWAKDGYQVVVYCDCGKQEGLHDGVLYLPYYKFNPRDNFNIFINWRSNHLAGKIKAKKFLIDLHDLFPADVYKNYNQYDKLMVKSEYHKSLAKDIPDEKIRTISNGI